MSNLHFIPQIKCKNNYENVIYIDFRSNESYKQIFEVDFVIENKTKPLVIEVKATNSKSKSLSTIATNPTNYGSKDLKCIKLYEKNISINKDLGIINLPYYVINFLDFNKF